MQHLSNGEKKLMRLPAGSYIATGAICGFIAVMSLMGGNGGGALFFGVGVGINTLLYRNAREREERENKFRKS